MPRLMAPPVPPEPVARGEVALSAADVGVRLGGKQIIAGIDLDLRAGELAAIVGPNGAGKSTLLGALSGDRRYTGSVILDGRQVSAWRAPELALRRAVLRQDNPLSFPFTALDVVKMGRAPWQRLTTPAEDERVIAQEMTRTDTLRFAERRFTSLSGGERARVALTRVLVQQAPVLLLDEPTAALDVNFQEHVLAIARRAARQGAAAAVVLHDLTAAAAYADRLLLLDEGRPRAYGAPAEVLDGPMLSEVYGHPIDVRRDRDGSLHVIPLRFADDDPEDLPDAREIPAAPENTPSTKQERR